MQKLEDLAISISRFDVRFISHIPKCPVAAENDGIITVVPSFPLFTELLDFGFWYE